MTTMPELATAAQLGPESSLLRIRPAVRGFLERPVLTPADLSMVLLVRADGASGELPMSTVTIAEIPSTVREMTRTGIRSVKLFAGSQQRDDRALGGTRPGSLMAQAIDAVKSTNDSVAVMTETCLCSHTLSGHCFLAGTDGAIDLTGTAETMAAQALVHAAAGADIVGPASMVNGMSGVVRRALDTSGHRGVAIMPHLIFDSAFYTGYRATMKATPASGEHRPYQVHPARPDQAVECGLGFLADGADMLLLEPGLTSVDVLIRLKQVTAAPLMPFSVSGEYTALAPVGGGGQRDLRPLAETFTMLKRSGADHIITYAAVELARTLG
ncbi:hypothetical protein [Kitasatospora sp. NPDC002040]|uniref:hypothetical protein n=1 Tax=Kitasatospora sp. NPDC002040 TaxID=3154661 RepID=UPI003329A8FB